MINVQDITSVDWSMQLDQQVAGDGLGNVVQGIDDVNQCIRIICTTPKGSDPLRPDFAVDLTAFIDLPIDIAITSLIREFADAITKYEPRVKLVSISAKPALDGAQAGAQLEVSITWQLNLDNSQLSESQQTFVTIPFGA